MSAWAAKRFWKEARVEAAQGGFTVSLDGRGVKTPAKTALVVPTEAMAAAIALEWDAQEGKIDPRTMPVTRTANAALDKVAPQHAEVAAMLAEYGGTDLLCYRAERQPILAERQEASWGPWLAWAAERYGAELTVTAGVIPVAQPEAALARLAEEVAAIDAFRLAAFHDLVMISGSLVLALAFAEGRLSAEAIWDLARLDESYQIEEWGADEEAAEEAELKRAALLHAGRFWALCTA